ncbi:MAG: hypothetical protein WBC70_13690 [Candidatus Aminicenantales bacterium]
MRRKGLVIIGAFAVLFVLFSLQSCRSTPEKGLLGAYFHAISLKDTATMSSMAVEPVSIDHVSWDIVSVSEEKIEPTSLVELGKAEMEFKKKLEEHVGPVMDAEDALYGAQEELKAARTGASRAAAKRKVDEMQAKFDEERELHKELQRNYNEAKAAAEKERDIAIFSVIGPTGELPNIMDLAGTVHSKDVDAKVVDKAGEEKLYRFNLKRYELRDEASNISHRGRWVIVQFGPVA